MKKTLAALHQALDRHDVLFFGGLGLLGYGLFEVYWPLGFIVPGGILTWFGIYTATPPAPPRRENDQAGAR